MCFFFEDVKMYILLTRIFLLRDSTLLYILLYFRDLSILYFTFHFTSGICLYFTLHFNFTFIDICLYFTLNFTLLYILLYFTFYCTLHFTLLYILLYLTFYFTFVRIWLLHFTFLQIHLYFTLHFTLLSFRSVSTLLYLLLYFHSDVPRFYFTSPLLNLENASASGGQLPDPLWYAVFWNPKAEGLEITPFQDLNLENAYLIIEMNMCGVLIL